MFTAWLAVDRAIPAPLKLAACGAISVAVLAAFVVPALGNMVQEPVKQIAKISKTRGYEVVMWGLNAPSFSVYYGRPTAGHDPRPGDVVVTKAKRLGELPPYEPLYATRGIALVRIKP